MHTSFTARAATTDIVIAGGGLAGASMALLLAKAAPALRITLVESLLFSAHNEPLYQPSFDERSSALAYGSRDILDKLGVWQALAQHACPILQVQVSDRGHPAGVNLEHSEQGAAALGYVIENRWMGQVLVAALRASTVQLHNPARVVRAQAQPGGYALTLATKDTDANEHEYPLACQLLIVADGAHSILRTQLGIGVSTEAYGQVAVIANIETEHPHAGVAFERFTAQGPLAFLPLNDCTQAGVHAHRSALVWTFPQQEQARIAALDDADFLALLQQHFGHRLGKLLRVGSRHMYALERIQAQEQVRNHLVLLGNAAHSLHPVAGQGFNLTLRDCATLAQCIAQAVQEGKPLGRLDVLRGYEEARQADQQRTISASDWLPKLFSTGALGPSLLRNAGMLGLSLLPGARRAFTRYAMGLGDNHGR